MNELEIINKQLPEIEFKGYDDLKKQLEEDVSKYQNYIVTQDTLDFDTKLRAELNKKAKAIDDKRKEIEALISAPIKEFKNKCDVLKNLYVEVSKNIDIQIKKFEEDRKKIKKDEINQLIYKLSSELGLKDKYRELLEFDERYLNKTYSIEEVQKDLSSKIQILLEKQLEEEKNIEAIKKQIDIVNQNTKIKLDAEDFIQKLNYMSFQDIILEINAKSKKIEAQEKMIQQDLKSNTINIPKVEVKESENIFEYKLKITGTKTQLITLRQFMEQNNITYEKLGDNNGFC